MTAKRNFNCPLTEESCTNERCRRDRCVDQLKAELNDKMASGLEQAEQQRLRQLYEDLGVEIPPGKLEPPKISN